MQRISEGGVGQVEIREANGRSRRTFVEGDGAGPTKATAKKTWKRKAGNLT